jgi:hypothetical protein
MELLNVLDLIVFKRVLRFEKDFFLRTIFLVDSRRQISMRLRDGSLGGIERILRKCVFRQVLANLR